MNRIEVILALLATLLVPPDVSAQAAGPQRKPTAALASLPAAKSAGLRILLVDDNASPNNIAGNTHRNQGSDDVYRELVAGAVGGDVNAWSLEVAPYRKDGPTLERLRDFDVVVWYTGDSYGAGADTLSKQDENTVRSYLQETGGVFVLVSPGYVSNLIYGSTWERADYPFLTEVIGVKGVAPLAQRFASGRVSSSSGSEFAVTHPGVAETQFSAVNSNGATVLFTATLDPLRTAEGPVPVAVANQFGSGRFVYVVFTLENIPSAERSKAFGLLLDAAGVTPAPATPAPVATMATAAKTPVAVASGGARINPALVPAPVAVKPEPGVIITGPAVRFQWRHEPDAANPARYEICVSEQGQPCSSPTAVMFKLTGTPIREIALENRTTPGPAVPEGTPNPPFFYPATLPYSLQGKRLQWSVMACTTNPGQATIAGRSSEQCAASSPSSLTWTLPAPTLASPANHSMLGTTPNRQMITPPVFAWTYGDAQGVEYFRFCIAKPGVACPTRPGLGKGRLNAPREMLFFDLAGAMSTTITQDLSPFMGQALSWNVAACNATVGCSYPTARQVQVPILVGSFEAIYQVTQHDKCLNCHEMHKENAVYLRHVAQGRFTREELPPNDIDNPDKRGKCRTCHTTEAGFPRSWSAPRSTGRLIQRQPMSWATCEGLKEEATMSVRGISHLKTSEDILWAVNQIPDLGTNKWLELINTWNRQCPCTGLYEPNCVRRGQFGP